MALFEYKKYVNHFHGDAPGLFVDGDVGNMQGNSVTIPAKGPKTGFEIFKMILTSILNILGALFIAYLVYKFGWK